VNSASFKFVEAQTPTDTSVVADCGAGFVAISGGGDCSQASGGGGGNNSIQSSCPCTSATCTACEQSSILPLYPPQRFWRILCSGPPKPPNTDGSLKNIAYATCVPVPSSKLKALPWETNPGRSGD
jgi:hypothetical protein